MLSWKCATPSYDLKYQVGSPLLARKLLLHENTPVAALLQKMETDLQDGSTAATLVAESLGLGNGSDTAIAVSAFKADFSKVAVDPTNIAREIGTPTTSG
jgi:hypothetical protein